MAHRHRHRQPAGPLVQPAREHGAQGDRQEARIPTRVYETQSESSGSRTCSRRAKAGYNLIFAVGFLNYSALNTVAPKFPKLQYAGIDEAYALFSKKPKNAAGHQSSPSRRPATSSATSPGCRQEGGFEQIISAVGANNVPAIVRYISGYIQGAKKANPRIKVLANYANDTTFNDQAKCHETALNQINQGSQVIFQVAGGCGLGALTRRRRSTSLGHRRRRRPAYLGSAHHDERAEDGRQGRRGPDEARVRGQAEDRQRTTTTTSGTAASASARSARRSRRRTSTKTKRSRSRSPRARSRSSPSSSSRHDRSTGVGVRPPPRIAAMADEPASRRSRAQGNHQALPAASSRTTTSTSISAAARCTRCSARTAPASRR